MVNSSSSTPWPFILIITICFFAAYSSAFDDDDHYLGHTCSSSTPGTNTNYSQALKYVTDDLANTASTPGNGGFGFWKKSQSWPDGSQYRVYGLAQCRLDVSNEDCKTCVTDAATEVIYARCPNSRSATIWRVYCELKYSDVDFFGIIDTDNKLTITDGRGLYSGSQQAANTLLSSLTQTALERSTFFANGTSAEAAGPKIYGMVQCTGDLPGDDCRTCLDRAMSDLSKCCETFSRAQVNFGSCNVRREMYRFLKDF